MLTFLSGTAFLLGLLINGEAAPESDPIMQTAEEAYT